MRLYHSRFLPDFRAAVDLLKLNANPRKIRLYHFALWIGLLVIAAIFSSCSAPQAAQGDIHVTVSADGHEKKVNLIPGSSVQDAISAAGLTLGSLDRSEPPLYSVLADGDSIRLIRVREEFKLEQALIPFEHQVIKNETMTEGESRLVQAGVNGLQEITNRWVLEDGKEIASAMVKSVVIKEALPEIIMVGSQAPFAPFPVPGKLVYLLGGNAWVIEGSTGNRKPVVTTGDLDGRIFSLSPDGAWILFTRRSQKEGTINTLWAAKLGENSGQMVDLKITNIIHFADWKPGSTYTIAYSTVEPRASAPGWQANNDLRLISMDKSGVVKQLPPILDTNMGGNYGWWGMSFAWSPDGSRMAYARPDGMGLVDMDKKTLIPLINLTSLQTGGDWAWVPGLAWGQDGKALFTVDHVAAPGEGSPEQSPLFDLAAVPLTGGHPVHLVTQAGMFTYPLPSGFLENARGENASTVAYLQAIFPTQSESGRYRIALMDRDGSNRHILFPEDGAPGLDPQVEWGAWSPAPLTDSGNYALAVIYQKNLWLVDVLTGSARQITGDALVNRVEWK
ncbi:MAG: G5 domain-containing protein [Omnitrophica WOR_2 bacterium]